MRPKIGDIWRIKGGGMRWPKKVILMVDTNIPKYGVGDMFGPGCSINNALIKATEIVEKYQEFHNEKILVPREGDYVDWAQVSHWPCEDGRSDIGEDWHAVEFLGSIFDHIEDDWSE